MILKITIAVAVLIAINFLLLIFSCNKTTKRKPAKEKVQAIRPTHSLQHTSNQLAPTGS